MIDQLSQIFGTSNPAEIIKSAHAMKESVGELQTDLERVTAEKADIQEDRHMILCNAEKQKHKATQYLDMIKCGAIKKSPEEALNDLIQGVVIEDRSIFDFIDVPDSVDNCQ